MCLFSSWSYNLVISSELKKSLYTQGWTHTYTPSQHGHFSRNQFLLYTVLILSLIQDWALLEALCEMKLSVQDVHSVLPLGSTVLKMEKESRGRKQAPDHLAASANPTRLWS